MQAAKGREGVYFGLLGISDKFGAGATEQALDEIVMLLNRSKTMGFSRSFMHFLQIGYFLRKPLIKLTIAIYVLTLILLGSSAFAAFPDALTFGIFGLLLSQAITTTGIMNQIERKGLVKGLLYSFKVLPMVAIGFMSLIYTAFSIGSKKAYNNKADYVATGRRPGRQFLAPFRPTFHLNNRQLYTTAETDLYTALHSPINLGEYAWVVPFVVLTISGIILWNSPAMIWSFFYIMLVISSMIGPFILNPGSTPVTVGFMTWAKNYWFSIKEFFKKIHERKKIREEVDGKIKAMQGKGEFKGLPDYEELQKKREVINEKVNAKRGFIKWAVVLGVIAFIFRHGIPYRWLVYFMLIYQFMRLLDSIVQHRSGSKTVLRRIIEFIDLYLTGTFVMSALLVVGLVTAIVVRIPLYIGWRIRRMMMIKSIGNARYAGWMMGMGILGVYTVNYLVPILLGSVGWTGLLAALVILTVVSSSFFAGVFTESKDTAIKGREMRGKWSPEVKKQIKEDKDDIKKDKKITRRPQIFTPEDFNPEIIQLVKDVTDGKDISDKTFIENKEGEEEAKLFTAFKGADDYIVDQVILARLGRSGAVEEYVEGMLDDAIGAIEENRKKFAITGLARDPEARQEDYFSGMMRRMSDRLKVDFVNEGLQVTKPLRFPKTAQKREEAEKKIKIIWQEGSLQGKTVILIDDIIVLGGNLKKTVRALKEQAKADAVIAIGLIKAPEDVTDDDRNLFAINKTRDAILKYFHHPRQALTYPGVRRFQIETLVKKLEEEKGASAPAHGTPAAAPYGPAKDARRSGEYKGDTVKGELYVKGRKVITDIKSTEGLNHEQKAALEDLFEKVPYLAHAPPKLNIEVTSQWAKTYVPERRVTSIMVSDYWSQTLVIHQFVLDKLIELKQLNLGREYEEFMRFLIGTIDGHEAYHLRGYTEETALKKTLKYFGQLRGVWQATLEVLKNPQLYGIAIHSSFISSLFPVRA
jgi:hypoxanthine phosphoribosyltransferase